MASMPIIFVTAAAGSIIGWILTVARSWYRRPRLSIELSKKDGRLLIFQRILEEEASLSGSHRSKYDFRDTYAKDVSLSVKNKGKEAAKDCSAHMKLIEDGQKIHKPIRMGWRRNAPTLLEDLSEEEKMRKRTDSIDINRKESSKLDLLRQSYSLLIDTRTADSKIIHKDLKTHSTFRGHEFDEEKNYEIEIVVTSSNAEPVSTRLKLNYRGQILGKSKREKLVEGYDG